LYAAIVARADERSLFIENCGADGNAALSQSFVSFGDGDGEHGVEIQPVRHREQYTQLRGNRGWLQTSRLPSVRELQSVALRKISRGEMRYYEMRYYLSRKSDPRKFEE
jgi:hypothetical protein